MNKLLSAFAIDWTAFILQNLREKDISKIKSIILFGSVARGTAGPKSDIDIFVVAVDKKGLERQIINLTEQFYESELYKKYWKLLGIENSIKPIIDKLENWADLKISILANGITLYGKYTELIKGRNAVLIWWGKVKPEGKRTLLSKKLYGWSYKKKKYIGLVEKIEAIKLGPNTLLVTLENAQSLISIFKEFDITIKTKYINLIE